MSVTDVENVTDTPVNIRNIYPARAALLESRHTARRVHRRISRNADLRAAAKREVAEQLRRAKQELAGKQGADFGDYLMALAKHAPPEERAARERAQASIKTRDACGECGRKLAAEEPAYRGVTYTGWSVLAARMVYSNALLCGECAPTYLVESRRGSDGFYVFVHQRCMVCTRVTVFRTTWDMWHRKRHIICSQRCEWSYYNGIRNERNARAREKRCEVCEKPFTAARRDAKTCSPACRQKAYRQRARRASHRTTVINIKNGDPYDVYIGRKVKRGRYNLECSPWHNPFKAGKDGTHDEVVQKYERYLLEDLPDLVARLPELRGKTLACWCKPGPCHGDVLVRLANGAA